MSLVHLIREPAGDPDGALVLNHGRGVSEHDLFPLLDQLDPERRLLGVTPGGPLTDVPPGGRHWYLVPRVGYPDPDTFHRSYDLLTAFLDGLLAERGIAWDRTVIGGFSMGAVMAYAVALGEGRPSPAAIVALSGFVPTVDGWAPQLPGREGLPVLIHHGRRDPIMDVGFGRHAAERLREGGLDVRYMESDAGHWLPPEVVGAAADLVRSALPAAA
jgi:phospholipase/carboxylesterase